MTTAERGSSGGLVFCAIAGALFGSAWGDPGEGLIFGALAGLVLGAGAAIGLDGIDPSKGD
jgi:hypothetical protein